MLTSFTAIGNPPDGIPWDQVTSVEGLVLMTKETWLAIKEQLDELANETPTNHLT